MSTPKTAPLKTRILLVDDHKIMIEGLRLMLSQEKDFEIIGNAGTAEAAWLMLEAILPDVVILDYELPGGDGISLAHRIQTAHPEIRALMLTSHADTQLFNRAFDAGVKGYVLKLNAPYELVAAIRAVRDGQIYLSPEMTSVLIPEYRRRLKEEASSSPLSEREREMLKRMADGQSTKEIAFALNVSAKTVETHRSHIMAKVGVHSIAELTKYAIREGITTLT